MFCYFNVLSLQSELEHQRTSLIQRLGEVLELQQGASRPINTKTVAGRMLALIDGMLQVRSQATGHCMLRPSCQFSCHALSYI